MKIDKYWKKAEIDGLISFPILEFEMNGNGLINYYKSIDDIIGKWNHYMVEPIVKNELPDYLIDSKLKLFEIVFNEELRFKEPIQKGDLKIEKYEEFIENAEIENLILNDPTRKQLNELKKAMRPS